MKHGWLIVGAVGAAVAVVAVGALAIGQRLAPATAQSSGSSPSPTSPTAPAPAGGSRTIAVQGVGTVTGTPDTVTLSLGVQVQGASAAEALETASSKAQAIIDTLTGAGVAKADVQTGSVNVYPVYSGPDGRANGYWASNSVTAVVHDITKAGPIIDAATKAVGDGTTLGGVSFSIADTSALYAQARKMAVEQARQHAEQLAEAAGGSVGAVLSIDESAQDVPVPVAYAPATTAAAGSMGPPIEPGRQQLQLSVKVVFGLES